MSEVDDRAGQRADDPIDELERRDHHLPQGVHGLGFDLGDDVVWSGGVPAEMTPSSPAISLATSVLLPALVWMSTYACTAT